LQRYVLFLCNTMFFYFALHNYLISFGFLYNWLNCSLLFVAQVHKQLGILFHNLLVGEAVLAVGLICFIKRVGKKMSHNVSS